MNPQIITVSEFIGIINETLGFAYPQVVVEGEVSSFKVNQGKFVFFDLKDDANVMNCFMMVHQLKLPIEDGMKIRVTGSPKVTRYSKFSLTVRSIELAGEGELRRAMALLKAKLEAEGLFDEARKRTLPPFPTRIGLITSGTSAAYSDFIKILGERWGGVEVLLADVSVQGTAAPDQIIGAIEYFNELRSPVDVVVLIRGGGSLEDLIAFSTEPVARAVAASRTPIVVGVGHEIDVSLADYAADVRAATPTDAARLVVPDRTELGARVGHSTVRLDSGMQQIVERRLGSIDRSIQRLERYLTGPRERIEQLGLALPLAAGRLTETRSTSLQALERVMRSFDPSRTLERGYAIVRSGSTILRDPKTAKTGETLVIQLARGRLDAEAKGPHSS